MGEYQLLAYNERLEADKTFETYFNVVKNYGNNAFAYWLDGDKECSRTFNEMVAVADRCASALRSAAPEGAWIGLAVDTCLDWPSMFWGILRSGHNVLLLDAAATDVILDSILTEAGCTLMITKKTRNVSAAVRQLDFDGIAASPAVSGYTPVWGSHVAICTSGTTGKSRIFTYDQEAVCSMALITKWIYNTNHRLIEDRPVRILAFLPFHHVLAFMVNIVWAAFAGMGLVFSADRTPNNLMKTCRLLKPEVMVVVPLVGNNVVRGIRRKLQNESSAKRFAFKAMSGLSLTLQKIAPEAGLRFAQHKLFRSVHENLLGTSIQALIMGGSHTPEETLRALNAMGIYTACGFGMTETGITSINLEMGLKPRLTGSIGVNVPGIEYKVEGNDKGELKIKGASIHTGRLVGGQILPPDLDSEGYYPTGDIVSEDASGHYYVQGRLKDVIINESGENIYPDDLEDAFSAIPGVEEFTILGVQRNKKDSNEDVTLVVGVGNQYSDDAFMQKLTSTVARINAKQPLNRQLNRALATGSALPLVNGIKVKRLELKKLLAEQKITYKELDLHDLGIAGEVTAIEEKASAPEGEDPEILKKVRSLYAEALGVPETQISDTANFIEDLQGDSLQILSMALKAEEEWGITIPAEEYGRCATVRDMAREITLLLKGGKTENTPAERTPVTPVTRFEDAPEYLHYMQRHDALLSIGGSNPYFICHESPLRDTGIVDGKEILEFGSYNYVCMSGRKEVKEAAKAAIDKYGTSASGARLLAGEKKVHQDLEAAIARWKHTEDAVVCVGGHSTNVTFVGNFCGKNDLILYDALAHNSIEQGCKLSDATARPFPHSDAAALENILKSQRAYYEKVLIVIEGAYSMDGDIAPVPDFVRLKKKYGCFLMVDEAHSACVIGEHGGGVDEYFNLAPDDIDIKYGTLSKGLGTCGGYLAGKKTLIEYLKYNMPGFVFSVGMSPALAAASLEAIHLLETDPTIVQGLHNAIKAFADCAKRHRLDICLAGETAVLPVLVGRDEDAWLLSDELKKRGVSVPPAMYPAVPKGKARLRFCVVSEHKPEQIERALDILEEAAADLGITLPRRDYN